MARYRGQRPAVGTVLRHSCHMRVQIASRHILQNWDKRSVLFKMP